MIEEVTELPGTAPTTEAVATATATDEKPKVTRRRTTKKAEATLPLEGIEAKPKRATRAKKADAADGETAPEKPKRATRAKKSTAKTDTEPKVDAEAKTGTEAKTDIQPKAGAETVIQNANNTEVNATATPAPSVTDSSEDNSPSPLQQTSTIEAAPLQAAPAVAVNSMTPALPPAPMPEDTREETPQNQTQTATEQTATEIGVAPPQEAQREGSGDEGEEDFRSNRLSYRDRRALRREQRIVARANREDGETSDVPHREILNRENGTRETPNRETSNRENGTRELHRENRDNSHRDGREGGNRERPNRDGRDNRERSNRENRRDGRDNRRDNRENGFSGGSGRRREYDLAQLEAMNGEELQAVVAELNMEEAPGEKSALIYAILEAQAHAQNAIMKKGILEILPDGKGFLRCENYYPSEGDVYVSQTQIKRFGLKTGDEVLGTSRVPKENERYHGLLRVESINGLSIEVSRGRRDFDKLTPIFPTERFPLETEPGNITARIIDLISPIGKGQRGLIVAPPKAGKTTLIKNIANSITQNNPEVLLFVLLIDERPEEVTDISRSIRGEVVASTFDEVPENHIRVSDMVMERAKRLVEQGHDVVVLMDSITRLSRASNLVVAPSGRTMSGGLDPAAMYKPKRHFGAARNIENGGSLTVLATVLVDTGSRMDEYIFEELKGTGNLDLVLDRDLFNQRIFPAIDINRSGTRRDDLLMSKEELAATFHLRRTLAALDNDKAVTLLIDRLKNTKTNADFMEVVAKSQRNSPA